MLNLYKLITNTIKRLAALIISTITAALAMTLVMLPVIYFIVWLSTFFYDQKPPLSEAWYLWPFLAFAIITHIYLSDRIEKHLLNKLGIQGGKHD